MLIFNNRIDMITSIIKDNLIIAEIGVLNGDFSKEFLKLNPSILYLVDIWSGIINSGDENGNNIKEWNLKECYNNVKNKFNKNSNVKIIKENSISFLENCQNDYFDIIYLDTTHEYEDTIKEFNSAWPKIKKGGYLMGHDFDITDKCNNKLNFGVDKAIFEICLEKKIKITALAFDGCISFALKK
jgi:hypothetical protein